MKLLILKKEGLRVKTSCLAFEQDVVTKWDTMGKRMQRRGRNKRGIVGIEAAIVLIAFVVIAAALAYVVINMGFYSAQTAKSTIDKGIQEATSALELDGFVTGKTNSSNAAITYLVIPLKLAVGQEQVDLAGNTVVVAVQGLNFSLANIYSGAATSNETDLANLMANVTNAPNARCFIYNSELSTDTTLKQNAKAYLVINLGDLYGLPSYSKAKVEIRTSKGAALMVMREIPGSLPPDAIVDLR
jgi:flagellin FlaB